MSTPRAAHHRAALPRQAWRSAASPTPLLHPWCPVYVAEDEETMRTGSVGHISHPTLMDGCETGRRMRILLVEDELKMARAVRRGLEEEGYAVDAVSDGEDGLHRA